MEWAQASFANFFPGAQPTIVRTGFVVRYYPESGNFLAVTTAGEGYALGPVTGGALVLIGNVSAFACLIYPDSCPAQVSAISALAPFGKVVQGLEVVDLIRMVPTTTRTGDRVYQDIPVTDVVIQSVTQTR